MFVHLIFQIHVFAGTGGFHWQGEKTVIIAATGGICSILSIPGVVLLLQTNSGPRRCSTDADSAREPRVGAVAQGIVGAAGAQGMCAPRVLTCEVSREKRT